MPSTQRRFEFGPSRNSGLFSSHWLEHRLPLEPEPAETQAEAGRALADLASLWVRERDRVALYGDEPGLEHAFIQPVFAALGWKLKYQTFLDRRKPDYALFLSDADHDAALAAGRESLDFWRSVAVVADAKAWHISLDHRIGRGAQKEYPPQQIEWYLERSRVDFGILTNGRVWRLYPREREPYQGRFETYFEFDLAAFLTEHAGATDLYSAESLLEDFQRFYLFFGPAGFSAKDDRVPLIRRAVQGSSEYRLGINEDVRERAFEALRLCVQGFLDHSANGLDPVADLERCRDESFVLIYRLLFAMYGEDRGLLPYGRNRLYTENRSLRRLRDEVASEVDATRARRQVDYSRESIRLWGDLRGLFDLIDKGGRRYDVPAYNGGLFDADEHPFLDAKQISDWHLARVIDRLGRAFDPKLPEAGLFPIDYRDLAIQHLGGIYEGMLELHPCRATVPMAVVSKRTRDKVEERIVPETAIPTGFARVGTTYKPGDVFLQTNKGERRASGSYYTPDHIVQHIVAGTLGPVCAAIDAALTADIAAAERNAAAGDSDAERKLTALRQAFDDRVLALRVLDPAMGSGHFLLRACSYLAEEIATNPHTGEDEQPNLAEGESALTYWKRQVAERCLFGVDRNGMAVELAKLALWLETVAADRPLTFLNHRLRPGDSLIGAKIDRLGAPPDAPGGLLRVFQRTVAKKLPAMLEPLNAITALASD